MGGFILRSTWPFLIADVEVPHLTPGVSIRYGDWAAGLMELMPWQRLVVFLYRNKRSLSSHLAVLGDG